MVADATDRQLLWTWIDRKQFKNGAVHSCGFLATFGMVVMRLG